MTQTPDEPMEQMAEPQALSERIVHVLKRASLLGIAISLLVHICILIVSALISFDRSRAPTAEPFDEGFEFAMMTEAELTKLQESALVLEDPSVPEVTIPDVMDQELLDSPDSADLAGVFDDIEDFGPMTGGGDIGDGSAIGSGGAGSGGANFFGVEAEGSRFAYIVDVSGSMAYAGKMDATKVALMKSVDGLGPSAEYLIVLYSGDSWPLGGKTDWKQATDRIKQNTRRLIARINPNGSTNPSPAFMDVFSVRPRPDAIYFMTDGEFPRQVATEVASMNQSDEIPIHCITFVSRDAEDVMRQIAARSGGSYTHVPGPGGGP